MQLTNVRIFRIFVELRCWPSNFRSGGAKTSLVLEGDLANIAHLHQHHVPNVKYAQHQCIYTLCMWMYCRVSIYDVFNIIQFCIHVYVSWFMYRCHMHMYLSFYHNSISKTYTFLMYHKYGLHWTVGPHTLSSSWDDALGPDVVLAWQLSNLMSFLKVHLVYAGFLKWWYPTTMGLRNKRKKIMEETIRFFQNHLDLDDVNKQM